MSFSAGTIFLDVVPSFNNIQRRAAQAARGLGRPISQEIDKSLKESEESASRMGAKAGEKYGSSFQKTLRARLRKAAAGIKDVGVDVDANTRPAELALASLRKEMLELSKKTIGVDVDADDAIREINRIERSLRNVRDDEIDLDIRTNAGQAIAELEAVRRYARDSLLSRSDLAEAQQQHRIYTEQVRVQARQRAEAQKQADRSVTSNLRNEVAQRRAMLAAATLLEKEATDQAGRTGSREDVTRATAAIAARYKAEQELAQAAARERIQAAARGYAGEVAAAKAAEQAVKESERDKTDTAKRQTAERIALARLEAQAVRANSDRSNAFANWTGQAANSFRLFNGYLLTAVTLGPVLIPILAALAGGMGALSVMTLAAGGAIAALFAGFAGIGGAVTALSNLDKERRKQSTSSGASSATDTRGLRDAQLALARAREDAGRRIASANATQANSERALTKAVEDATKAQQDLIDARRQAAEDLEDQNNRLASGLLDEALGAYNLEAAGQRLNNILEDDQASEREKAIARLEYQQQVQQYKELQIQNKRLARDVAEANKKGVEGSDAVVKAKENIVSANESVADAERAVADARAEVARAQVEEARTLADAEQRVADAMIDLQKKSVEAGVEGSAAMDALNEAMRNLTPAGREFATFLYGLKPLLDGIRGAAQDGLLPGVQEMLQMLVDTYGPKAVEAIGLIAGALGDMARQFGTAFTEPFWVEFFDMMAEMAPDFIRDFGSIALSIMEVFAGIAQAFAPVAAELSGWLVELADGAAEWAKGLASSDGFQGFLDYLNRVGPKVGDLFGNIVEIFLKLAEGLAPYAEQLLDTLLGFTDWLAGIDPDTLATLALGVMAFVTAIQALAGVISILSSVAGLLGFFGVGAGAAAAGGGAAAAGGVAAGAASGPIGWIVLAIVAAIVAIVALVGWLKHLYDTSEEFKQAWDQLWENVSTTIGNVVDRVKQFFEDAGFSVQRFKDTFEAFYNTVIVPISDGIKVAIEAVQAVWEQVWGVLSVWIQTVRDALVAFYEKVIVPVFTFIGQILDVFWQVVSTVFNMVWQIIVYVVAPIFQWLYDSVIKPVFGWIGDRISWVWENMIKPVFNALKDFISTHVAPAFQAGIDAIARIWNTLMDIAKMPIEFVVNTVINKGIIDNFNKLVDIFPGMSKVDHITLPWAEGTRNAQQASGSAHAVATGGILPGYTPGRDVHRFTSPSAGTLLLSGGEGILRPELTAAIGKRRWDAANKAARQGDIAGGLAALGLGGGMATGGIYGGGNAFAEGGILGWLSNTASNVGNIVSDALGGVRDIAGAILAAPLTAFKGIVNGLLPDNPTGLMGVGVGMVNKVLDGVISTVQGAKDAQGGTEGDPSYTGARGEGGIGMGYQAQIATLHSAFPGARITSSYRPGAITAVGTQSYHGKGRAIDIAPSWAVFDWLASNFPNSRELIYTPAGGRQLLNGRQYDGWAPITRRMHNNHIHWAMNQGGIVPNLYDQGGVLPTGLSVVANKTGKPEAIFTNEQGQALAAMAREKVSNGSGGVNFYGDVNGGEHIAGMIADRIETRQRDAAALNGVGTIGVTW